MQETDRDVELITLQERQRLTEHVERVSDDRIVVIHRRYHTPKYGDIDEYVAWERKTVYIRNNGELVVHTHSKTYNHAKEEMHTVGKDPISYTFELGDDNQTVVHDGRTWEQYAIERARELVNTRWNNHRKDKTPPKNAKEAIKEQIEAEL